MPVDRIHSLIGICLLLLLVSARGYSQDNSGMVVASRGDVSVISNGESRLLRQGDFVAEKDQIIAAERSFTVIQLFDGSKISLRPESALFIEQFQFSAGNEDRAILALLSGGLRLVPGAIAAENPDNFRIRTPDSLMAVEGKESSLSLCGEAICEKQGLTEIPE
jgi:hypothetical protein